MEQNRDKSLFSVFKKVFRDNEKPGKYQYFILIFLFGAAIMVFGNYLFNVEEEGTTASISGKKGNHEESVEALGKTKPSRENEMIKDYESYYESQLKDALEQISGVSDVTVVVNIDATEKRILEKNTTIRSQETNEVDQQGGERKVLDQSEEEQIVIVREGDKEVPIVLETKKPRVRGVLVVAKGAENVQVEKRIIEAVTKLLDVPSHRVSVMPRK